MTTNGTTPVAQKSDESWETVIGLEVHVQLATRTKLFCPCEIRFGAEPNSLTCPVCTGQPGALPVLNSEALALAVRGALALGCEVADWSKFDRKNYFYCDLPKGYQISQYDQPYCTGGALALPDGGQVGLTRIHLEEDAGKATHDRGAHTLVDLNRAGVPLIESVTEPDIRSSAEAYAYLSTLKERLQYAGVSGCDMEKGELRCDVNISVRHAGEPLRTKVEIKNLNSFRNVQAAIEFETTRQIAAYESGDESLYPVQETRLFDVDKGETRTMRSKENEADYRYFPDPDLPPITVNEVFRERQRGFLPEMPAERRERYTSLLGLSPNDAGVLTSSRSLADFFEAVLRAGADAKDAGNWISNQVLRALSDPGVEASTIDELRFKPSDLAELIALCHAGTISKNAGKQVLEELLKQGGSPAQIVKDKGLEVVRDTAQIDQWCRAALAANSKVVAAVKDGNEKALGAAIGPVMQASRGSADPQDVRAALLRIIADEY